MFIKDEKDRFSEDYKDYTVKAEVGGAGLLTIVPTGKGRRPDYLTGKFTSFKAAVRQIDEYARTLKPKVIKSASQ